MGPEHRQPFKKPELVRRGNFTDIHLPTGSIRAIYGVHGSKDGRHSIPINVTDIPRKTRGIVLESSGGTLNDKFADGFLPHQEKSWKGVVNYARENGIPIFSSDISLRPGFNELSTAFFIGKGIDEVALALTALGASSPKNLLLAAPFLLDIGPKSISMSREVLSRKIASKTHVARSMDKMHPYMFPVRNKLRNTLWAYTTKWLLEQYNDPQAHLTTVSGTMHAGGEKKYLEDQDSLLRSLARSRKFWPLISHDLSTFYSIVGYFPNPKTGEFTPKVFEVPELKKLAEA